MTMKKIYKWVDDWLHPERDPGSYRTWRWRLLAVWVALFTFIVIWMVWDARSAPRENCERISILIQRQLPPPDTIGAPGTAGYDYYRTHPEELQRARESAKRRIEAFDPAKCR